MGRIWDLPTLPNVAVMEKPNFPDSDAARPEERTLASRILRSRMSSA
jgi:hypothetical protein